MWERFIHPDGQRSVGDIEINHALGVVRKTFSLENVARQKPWLADSSDDDCRAFFENDVKWLKVFNDAGADFVPKLLDVDERARSYVIPYLGHDLLVTHVIPGKTSELRGIGFRQQILEQFNLYSDMRIYKYNHAAINHCLVGQRVMVIDFKWASLRDGECHRSIPDREYAERWAIDNWMIKLDPGLPDLLHPLI